MADGIAVGNKTCALNFDAALRIFAHTVFCGAGTLCAAMRRVAGTARQPGVLCVA